MKIKYSAIFCVVLLAGCEDTEECKALQTVLKARKEILSTTRAQAGALDVLEKRATAAENAASKVLRSLWLSEPESKVQETLEKRVKAIPGATIERTTTPVNVDSADEGPISETMWIVRFKDPSVDHAFQMFDMLTNSPPLVKIATLLRDREGSSWRVELIRAAVDQVPINPQPVRIPPPDDLGAIPKQLGFCGAGKLRDDIAEVDAEIRSKMVKAERTTVLLPTTASWDGLRGRAELLRDTEMENRRHLRMFRDSVMAGELSFKAFGVESSMVFLEIWGKKTELAKLEREIAKRGGSESLQLAKGAPEGVIRVMVPNAIERARRSRMGGNRGPAMHDHGGELPADHPDVRARTNPDPTNP